MTDGSIYVVATADTKGAELAFIADRLRAMGRATITVDVGTLAPPTVKTDVDRRTVLDGDRSLGDDRGAAVMLMAEALKNYLLAESAAGRVAGVIGIGGSGGTMLITTGLRALPIGLPKVMVSTVAGGRTGDFVDSADIVMFNSVVDVAGLNAISKTIFSAAANAVAGMVERRVEYLADRPTIGMTMFGVTTPCVTAVRAALEAEGYDGIVFHATGVGGRAMEKLIDARFLTGAIDVTTTEVADEIVGGVFNCGPHRFEAMLRRQTPLVVSLGALDMVNFAAVDSVPEKFRGRNLYVHNSQVTLMRTTPDENRRCARFITERLNRSTAPLTLLIPEGGVSSIDSPGKPFWDPEADRALFDEIERSLTVTVDRRLIRRPEHINDPQFAAALVDEYLRIAAT